MSLIATSEILKNNLKNQKVIASLDQYLNSDYVFVVK